MSGTTPGGGTGDPEALQAQIARTRAELGETVEALAARADLRARAKEKVGSITARARRGASGAGPALPWAGVAALGVVAVALVAWWRNGRRHR
jgi:hypothetical protein